METINTPVAILALIWGAIFIAFVAIVGGHIVANMLHKRRTK